MKNVYTKYQRKIYGVEINERYLFYVLIVNIFKQWIFFKNIEHNIEDVSVES